MRDEAQEKAAIAYIESNPVKIRLCRVPEDWSFSSARFRDSYRRLVLPKVRDKIASVSASNSEKPAGPEAGAPTKASVYA